MMGSDPNAMGAAPDMGMDPSMMGGNPNAMGAAPDIGMDPSMMGGDPNAMGANDGATSPFDTNFDPGVEADEETDPKHFIQQLTGKLSTSLNSFNNDNGEPDPGLCKYVGKMIVKQAAKGLDDAGKKELIAAINSADSESTDDMDSNEGIEDDSMEGSEPDMQPADSEQPQQEPMMEYVITKKQLLRLSEGLNPEKDNEVERSGSVNKKQKRNTTFSGKKLK